MLDSVAALEALGEIVRAVRRAVFGALGSLVMPFALLTGMSYHDRRSGRLPTDENVSGWQQWVMPGAAVFVLAIEPGQRGPF